jgi:hypothetical protein
LKLETDGLYYIDKRISNINEITNWSPKRNCKELVIVRRRRKTSLEGGPVMLNGTNGRE